MHRLPVVLCASWHSLHGTGAPGSSTSIHTQIQSCDSLGSGHTMVAALRWTLQEGAGSHAHPISRGTAPACGGKSVSSSTPLLRENILLDLSNNTPPVQAPFLTMPSNLFHGKRQSLKQVALSAYIANPIF